MPSGVTNELDARRRFVAWLKWYLERYHEEVPTQAALAKRLRLTEGGLSQTLNLSAKRGPSFDTILAFMEFFPYPLDYVVRNDPPAIRVEPKRR